MSLGVFGALNPFMDTFMKEWVKSSIPNQNRNYENTCKCRDLITGILIHYSPQGDQTL